MLQICPPSNTGFIIVEPAPSDWSSFFVITFYACEQGLQKEPGDYYIGSIFGDPYNNISFRKKLERIRAKCAMSGITFYNSWGRVNIKAVRRQSDDEKYKRKRSKLINEYNRRVEAAKQSLYYHDELLKLNNQLNEALKVIAERYNQDKAEYFDSITKAV
jgi:hypothetical protein